MVSSTYSGAYSRARDRRRPRHLVVHRDPDPNASLRGRVPVRRHRRGDPLLRQPRVPGRLRLHLRSLHDPSCRRSGAAMIPATCPPAPTRDLVLDVGRVEGARRVRFTASGYETPGSGFAEIRGDRATAGIRCRSCGRSPILSTSCASGPASRSATSTSTASPEIVAQHEDGKLIAFEHDGTFGGRAASRRRSDGARRRSPTSTRTACPRSSPRAWRLDNQGNFLWDAAAVGGTGRGGRFRLVRLDRRRHRPRRASEVVAGSSAYRWNGALMWNASIPDGYRRWRKLQVTTTRPRSSS